MKLVLRFKYIASRSESINYSLLHKFKATLLQYKMISKAIGPYKSTITLKEDTLSIVLSKENDDSELFAIVTEKDIPTSINGFVESLGDLFKLIENLNASQISVRDGKITFILTLDGPFSFLLNQRFLKEQIKINQNGQKEWSICLNCQKWKEKVESLEEMNKKQAQKAFQSYFNSAVTIACLQHMLAMKEHHIQQLKAELSKTYSVAPSNLVQAFPPTLKYTFLLPSLTSNFFAVTQNQMQLSNVPGLPKVCLLISDEAIPSTGKQTIIVKYLQTNQNARESSVCVGVMGSDRAKTKSAGGKGQKFSIGFWNKKDSKANYPTQVYEQMNTDKYGEIWVDGEIVVINKKLHVPMGEWIRMDVDIQTQQVEFITKEGPVVTRKFPKNYEGRQFYFFVRMADPKEKIEIL